MACRNAYRTKAVKAGYESVKTPITKTEDAISERLLFGASSRTQTNDLLQNNIEQFEWIVRNKVYPDFYGRYMTGENCLTREEIASLHQNGCKVAAIYSCDDVKQTEQDGRILAKKIDVRALELGIPEGVAIFLELGENERVSTDFMRGFAKALMDEGYTPGFRANTDAKYGFDKEFSRGMRVTPEIFGKCLIWALAPTEKDYDGMTTSHLIHPDKWKPYAPSGITRRDIAIWQYGRNCHPIEDDDGKIVTFDLNLVRNERVIIDKMF